MFTDETCAMVYHASAIGESFSCKGFQPMQPHDARSVPMPPVILINPFEVPEGKDEAFLAEWEAAKAFMERQPGYLSTRLHRSRAFNTWFRFINVAEWGNRRGLSSCPQLSRI